ncbi:MAG: thioredoxin [Bacteroidales bacterium]|jgi:thioredoxin|nr:thioredoxin [Bacteroidales bacterium]MCI1785972.1 thioredoxin [Bacteroidales bacterium]
MRKVLTAVVSAFMFLSCGLRGTGDTVKDKKNMDAIHLDSEQFINKVVDYRKGFDKWTYKGDKPAIVDFYATWCGPCKMVSPILEDIATEYKDKIYVYKVDTDKEMELAEAFGIRSIPTILFIPMEGEPVVMQGARSKSEFVRAVNDILLKK